MGQNEVAVLNRSLADEVVALLRGAIQQGKFEPEEVLTEEALAKMYGVSRGPIREALRQLELEGLVVTRRNQRATVATLTPEKADEIFHIRLALETLAMRSVVRRAGPAELARIGETIGDIQSRGAKPLSITDAIELDLAFHGCLYELSGYPVLLQMWELLKPRIVLFLTLRNVRYPNYADILLPEHERIFAAIESRDEELAVKLLHRHIESAHDELMRAFKAQAAAVETDADTTRRPHET